MMDKIIQKDAAFLVVPSQLRDDSDSFNTTDTLLNPGDMVVCQGLLGEDRKWLQYGGYNSKEEMKATSGGRNLAKIGKCICWSHEYNAFVIEFAFPEYEHMDLGNDRSLAK